MKTFTYKLLISLLVFYIFFELTIGSRIDSFSDKMNVFTDHQSRIEAKEKIKIELKRAIDKENYFTEEERFLISNFIRKIKDELDLETNK